MILQLEMSHFLTIAKMNIINFSRDGMCQELPLRGGNDIDGLCAHYIVILVFISLVVSQLRKYSPK